MLPTKIDIFPDVHAEYHVRMSLYSCLSGPASCRVRRSSPEFLVKDVCSISD